MGFLWAVCAAIALIAPQAPAQTTPAPASASPNGQPAAPMVRSAIPVTATTPPPSLSNPISGPASAGSSTAPVRPGSNPTDSAPAMGSGGSHSIYFVGPDDVVEVKVYQEDDLLTTARVSKEGIINFPLLGSVSIGGRTPDDAARVIAGRLAKDYLVNPQVSLTVVEYSKRRFTVLGEVQKPGQYDMPDRDSVTLLEAIGAAGGYTRIADPGNIRLKRLEDGKETVFRLNAKKMANERQIASFEVKGGDIITVGEGIF
jgi:protein involved in polysaccharide export with SLBB domain